MTKNLTGIHPHILLSSISHIFQGKSNYSGETLKEDTAKDKMIYTVSVAENPAAVTFVYNKTTGEYSDFKISGPKKEKIEELLETARQARPEPKADVHFKPEQKESQKVTEIPAWISNPTNGPVHHTLPEPKEVKPEAAQPPKKVAAPKEPPLQGTFTDKDGNEFVAVASMHTGDFSPQIVLATPPTKAVAPTAEVEVK